MTVMTFTGTVVKWVDGDTVDAMVDLGFKVYLKQRFRLARINTPEKGSALYYEATTKANSLAPVGSKISIVCHGYDKYQRWIADIVINSVIVNDELLMAGLAVSYME